MNDFSRTIYLRKAGLIGPDDIPFTTMVDLHEVTIYVPPTSPLLSKDENVRYPAIEQFVVQVRSFRKRMQEIFSIQDPRYGDRTPDETVGFDYQPSDPTDPIDPANLTDPTQ